jgi:tetratricopeptide (TPR) repeat protein
MLRSSLSVQIPEISPLVAHVFLVLLRDDDDAEGLARLLNDVRTTPGEKLAEFRAPTPRGADYLRREPGSSTDQPGAAREDRTLVLMDEPGLERLITDDRDSFIVGLVDEDDAERYAALPQVATFVAQGPLDFAAEIMDRYSGPDAALAIFDRDEAARMRALTTDFPIDLEETSAGKRVEAGWERLDEGRVDEALDAAREALSDTPDLAEAHLLRGLALRQIITERLTHGIPVDEERQNARMAFIAALETGSPLQTEIGDNLLELGDAAGAARAYRRALEAPDARPGLHTSLGTALALDDELDDGFQQAIIEYTRTLELEPANLSARRSRGVMQIHLCRYVDALVDLDFVQALEHGEDAGTHMYRVIALSALGDLVAARRGAVHAHRLLASHDRPQWIEYVYGVVLLRLDDLDAADAAISRAEELANEADDLDLLARVKAAKALIQARLGQLDQARAACDASIQLDPTEPGPYATSAWISLNRDQLDDAADAIGQAVHHVETGVEWRQDCRFDGAKWPFYVTQACILNGLAERYADPGLAVEAITATREAWADFDKKRGEVSYVDAERGAHIFLERAYAFSLCNRPGEAAAALKQARSQAPARSRPWFAATRALGDAPAPPRIDWYWIVLVEILTVAGAAVLLQEGKLGSGAFSTLVIGLLTLGFVAFLLPTLTRFRVGTVEIERALATTRAYAMPRLAAPLPPPHIPLPRPQVRRLDPLLQKLRR